MHCGHDFPCEIDEVANISTKVCEVDLFVLTKVLCNITLKIHSRTSSDLPLTWQIHKKISRGGPIKVPRFSIWYNLKNAFAWFSWSANPNICFHVLFYYTLRKTCKKVNLQRLEEIQMWPFFWVSLIPITVKKRTLKSSHRCGINWVT